MATITARMTARKGKLEDLPKLLPGELGLATDYQRVFMGQSTVTGACDVSGSTASLAKVEFTTANGDPIDMDLMEPLNNYTYSITINPSTTNITITGANITFVDAKAQFAHGLVDTQSTPAPRAPTASDVFQLNYNKEVGYHAEAFPNPVQEITFNATASGVAQETGIDFVCANKDSVTIDYTLSHAGATPGSRRGTLSILMDNASGVPSTSSIKDEYDNSTGYADPTQVTFSLVSNSTDKFKLMFATTDTTNTQTFTYIQKSFK